MEYIRLTDANHEMFMTAMDLYWSCFGLSAQREFSDQQCIMDEPEYYFELILEDGEPAGLCLSWRTESFVYLEHLCVAHGFRGRGIARAAVERLKGEGRTLVLEADPAKGQAELFARMGFDANGFDHLRPSYHAMFPGLRLEVMSFPGFLSPGEYKDFYSYLLNRVMAP